MAGGRESREAFVTLATNDTYSLGCLVLGNSLRQVAKTTRQLVVMVTQGVSQSMRNQLSRVFDMIYDVNLLDSRDSANLQLLGRPDLSCTFTKLHCWRLTMFEKAVFLDADTLVLQNVDELFDREELSAAPDAGWPDCFNSGVFVFQPSEETYNSLLNYAMAQGSFDGGDQGLLNMYFRDWATKDINRHLPFVYNVVSQAFYSYLPAFTQFKQDVKIVHFIGATKPWHHPYNTSSGEVTPLPETGHSKEFLQRWWNVFMQFVQPFLDPSLGGLIGELAAMRVHSPDSMGSDQSTLSDQERKLNWERGQVDYLGADKFENIQKKLDKALEGPPSSSSEYTASPFRPQKEEEKPATPPSTEALVQPESSSVPDKKVQNEADISPPKMEKAESPLVKPTPVPVQPAKKEFSAPAPAKDSKQSISPASAAVQMTAAANKQTAAPDVTKAVQPATTTSSVTKPTTATGTAAPKPATQKSTAVPPTTKPGLKTDVGAPSASTKPAAQPTASGGSTTAAKSPTSPSTKPSITSRLPWMKK